MGQTRDEEIIRKVAYRIKELREQRQLTQEQFYNDTNIHIGRIESLNVNISISTLSMICNYFGITLSEFFRGI